MADLQQTAQLSVLLNGEQAKSELAELQKKAKELALQIDEAGKAGNTATAKQIQKQLNEVNRSMRTLKNETLDVNRVMNSLSSAKPKELNQTLSVLTKRLNDVKRGSEAWNILQEKIRKVKLELKNISAEASVAESRMSRLSGGFNKYFGMVTTFAAGITGLSFAFRKLAEDVAKMDDIYADVMKTTGMTKEEVKALNEEFKKTDTRTTRENLNAIAEEGGRIGIAKEDILAFTRAMDIANVALGDSFKGGVEEIAGTLGKLKFLFDDTKNMDVEKAYLSIGSAINELGANGVASEANIAEFAKRLGSLPAALKPASHEALALGAAFEESGIESEIASRAYNIVLKQASTNAEKFAKIMNLSAKETEAMINANPLEFFLKFSETMKGLSATDTSKWLNELGVNADGANKAIGAAANNTGRFRELLDLARKSFEDGTSVVNEFAIKNNTLAAKLEKAKKEFHEAGLTLGEKLNPILLQSTNAMTYIIKILPGIIDWFSKYGKIIVYATAVIASYVVATKLAVLWKTKFKEATILEIAMQKLKVVWLTTARIATLAYSAATALLTGNITRANAAMKLLGKTMKANVLGVALSAITAIGMAIYEFTRKTGEHMDKTKALVNINDSVNKSIAREKTELELLLSVARNESVSKEERLKAIRKINEISPEYLGNINLENIHTQAVTDSVKAYTEAILKNAKAKAIADKLTELESKRLENLEKLKKLEGKQNSTMFQRLVENKLKIKYYQNENNEIEHQKKLYSDLNAELFKTGTPKKREPAGIIPGVEEKRLANLQKEKGELEQLKLKQLEIEKNREKGIWEKDVFSFVNQNQLNMIDSEIEKTNRLLDLAKKLPEKPDKPESNGGGGGNGGGNTDKTSGQREAMNDALRKTETEHLEELSKIKNRYLSGDIATEYEYSQKLLEQQDKYDEERKKRLNELLKTTLTDKSVSIEALKQVADIEEKNFDRQIQQAGKIRKILLDADPVEAEKQAYENRLLEVGLFGKEKEDMTEEQQKVYELLLGQHLENMRKIDAKGVREKLEAIETEQKREETLLAQKRQKGLLTEGAYMEELLKLRKKYLNQRLAVPGLSQIQTENLNQEVSKNDTDTADAKTDERKKALDKYGLVPPKSVMEEAYASIADFEARGVLSHEEALKAKAEIDREYLDALTGKVSEASQKIQNVTGNLSSAISSFQEAETAAVEAKYDKQIKAAGKNDKKVKKLEEEKQKELNKIKAKYADKQFAVTVAQVIATTAVTAMESYKAMAGIPVVGPVLGAVAAAAAIAAGAGQIAVAKEQREAAKEGYATGGFTPLGPWDKPQGVVHSEEFIGNRFAVRTPAVRKVFNVVHEAQKNNTVSSLTEKDFVRALDYREAENRAVVSGISDAFVSSGVSKENETAALLSLTAFLNRNAEVIDRLDKKLDEPFVGEVSITGRKGIRENMDLYDKMIKNVSR